MLLRPGIQALVRDAQGGRFDLVLAEALDRVSRDQADVATLYKHLQFAQVPLVTLAEGEISELHVGLKGTMNALFLKDLAKKTHRGQRGRVEKGFSAGRWAMATVRCGVSLPKASRCAVNAGSSPPKRRSSIASSAPLPLAGSSYAIARALNVESVPGPSGRPWSDTTIRGRRSRGIGILDNKLYVGVRVEVPRLRIVGDALWQAVKRKQEALAEQYQPVM